MAGYIFNFNVNALNFLNLNVIEEVGGFAIKLSPTSDSIDFRKVT